MIKTQLKATAKKEYFPIDTIRADFPLLGRLIDEREGDPDRHIIYFDNAATSQKPAFVLKTVRDLYENYNANVHRSMNRLGEATTAAYEMARDKVRDFIGAQKSSEIIFTSGTTASINLVASAWTKSHLKPGDEILLTEMEHHSNLIPWQLAAEQTGARLRFIPVNKRGELDINYMESHWNERIKIVSIIHVSNVLGTVNPVRKIIRFAHARGAPVVIDGAQSVPHKHIDVKKLDCDFLAFSGHKMCGPTGIGVLYGKENLLEEIPPYMGGGEMISAVWNTRATWNELPYKFEAGTPNYAGAIGLGAAIDYLNHVGMSKIAKMEGSLTRYVLHELKGIEGIHILGEASNRAGVISFTLQGVHDHDLAQFLDHEGIAIRAGHHCAQPLMRKLGIHSSARVSFYFYNTIAEIERLLVSLYKAKEFFHHGAKRSVR